MLVSYNLYELNLYTVICPYQICALRNPDSKTASSLNLLNFHPYFRQDAVGSGDAATPHPVWLRSFKSTVLFHPFEQIPFQQHSVKGKHVTGLKLSWGRQLFADRDPRVSVDFLSLSSMGLNPSALGVGFQQEPTQERRNPSSANALGSDILDSNSHELRLEKSNILLLGPTGSGNVYTSRVCWKFKWSYVCWKLKWS